MKLICTLLSTVAFSAAMASCGDDRAEGPEAPAAIVYSKTGGIAGISEEVEIKPDGTTTIETSYPKPTVRRLTLSQEEVEELYANLNAAGFDETESPGLGTGCADCFQYDLARGDHSISGDDTNFPEELRSVAAQLDALIADARPVTQ